MGLKSSALLGAGVMASTPGAKDAALNRLLNGKRPKRAGKSTSKQSSDTTKRSAIAAPRQIPECANDYERYEWELRQRYHRQDRLYRWRAADGIYTIGPPIPPGAKVFFGESDPNKAFKLATAEGYHGCRPAAKMMGVGRIQAHKFFDRVREVDGAYSVYMGKKAGTRYHCRMIHEKSIKMLKGDLPRWRMEARKNGKKTTAANICRGRRD